MEGDIHSKILEGKGKNPKGLKFASNSFYNDVKFWQQKKMKKKVTIPVSRTPKGTYIVDSFTPEKVVDIRES